MIPPWLEIIKAETNNLYISGEFNSNIRNVLNTYGLTANLKDNRKIFWRILYDSLNKSRKNSFLVISTAREFLLTKIEVVNFLILILSKPDVVCIRNPNAWLTKRSNFGKSKFRYNLNSLIAILLRQILVRRSTFVICESQSQVKLIVSKFKNRNELNCLAFPGRLIDVRPRRDKDYNFIDSRFKLKVGVLGSLDDKKRDYESLLQALVKIEKDSRPTLYFLGSRIPSGSEIILQKFREVTKIYYSSEKRVSETDFYKLGENCDVLIAPLSLNFNYGANFGTGSVADGIALKKFILFPKSIEIDDTLEYLFIRYGNSEELQTLLSKEANEFLISESTYEWSVINMRKKLKLI